mmetsp:Transcript_1680/g.3379  ORF Transcript_1680/g.3379 Transcript_1680/m.3379 type:complete len:155 (-) Transcript_1680:77-541(-)
MQEVSAFLERVRDADQKEAGQSPPATWLHLLQPPVAAGQGEVVVWKGTHWPDNVQGQSAEMALVHRGPYVAEGSRQGEQSDRALRMAVNIVPRQEGRSHREADTAVGNWSISSVHVAKGGGARREMGGRRHSCIRSILQYSECSTGWDKGRICD